MTATRLLRPFLRVSQDPTGRERSPDEQLDDLRLDADTEGFELHPEAYSETASASKHAKKARKDFDRLITDLRGGTFGADGLALWESSRGSRQMHEWVLLLDLMAEQGLVAWVHLHERILDPRKPRDRKTLLEDGIASEYEASLTSVRVTRTAGKIAAKGLPYGKIPFGYRREYEVLSNGKRIITAQVPDEVEAPLVKELYERILKGHTMWAIADDWSRRGITTRTGKPFTQGHLRSLALQPTYAGWRLHAPGVRGRRHLGMEGTRSEGTWEGLVSRKDFLTVTRILTDASRRTWKPGGARHLLSMIAKCGVCGEVLTVIMKRGAERYRCGKNGCVLITKDSLEEYAVDRLLAYLSRKEVYTALLHDDEAASKELGAIEEQLAELRRDRDEAEAEMPADKFEQKALANRLRGLAERIEQLEARQAELFTPSVLRGLITPGADVRERWDAAEFSTQRAVARLVFSPRWAGELLVERSPVPGRSRHPAKAFERVVLRRESAE